MHPHYNPDTLEFYVREFRMKPMLFEVVILTKTDNDIGHTQFNLLMRLCGLSLRISTPQSITAVTLKRKGDFSKTLRPEQSPVVTLGTF